MSSTPTNHQPLAPTPVEDPPAAERAPRVVVYLSSNLPSKSQTFVYQEILGLRAVGAHVVPMTVRRNPFMPEVDARLGGVRPLIGNRLVRNAVRGLAANPAGFVAVARDVARGPFATTRGRVRAGWHAAVGLALAGHLRELDAAYVHVHHADVPTTVAMVAGAVARVPFGFTAHGADVLAHPSLVPQKAGRAAVVVAASDRIRRRLRELAPSEAAGAVVIRCGVPLERFRTPIARRPGPTLRLLNVGRLVDAKHHVALVAAAAELAARGVAFELRIVGEGPNRAALAAQIAEAGLQEQVILMGGLLNDDLPALYAWADAFVLSSLVEGMPVVLVEALASGLPVASTAVDGIPDFVRDGVDGILVPPNDVPALVAAIERLRDPAERERMGRNGVGRAKLHDLIGVADELLDRFPIARPPRPGGVPTIGDPLPISVIIAARDRADSLARALRSVAAQQPRPPAEIVVVDDGSTDSTSAVAEEHGARVVRLETSRGAAGARNVGIAAARMPWIAPLDSDDEWVPHTLATLWQARADHVLVTGTSLRVGPAHRRALNRAPGRDPIVMTSPADLVWPQNLVAASGVLVRRAAIAAAGYYDESLAAAEDFDLWLRVLERGTGIAVPAPVMIYHRHAGQKSADRPAAAERQREIIARYRDRAWWSAADLERRYAVTRWDRLSEAIKAGDRAAAREQLVFLGGHPRRAAAAARGAIRQVRARRGAGRVAADGLPAIAVLPSAAGQLAAIRRLVGDRPLIDLAGLHRRALIERLATEPPAMAFCAGRSEGMMLRGLGIRPLYSDRGESQTRGSARSPYQFKDGARIEAAT